MSEPAVTGTVRREESIACLRAALGPLAGAERSLCRVAAEKGVFCRGFRRWQAAEFDRRWRRAIGRSTHLSRDQMERYADIWQLAEQLRQGIRLPCDAVPGPDSPCRGWAEFSDEDLARFCRELPGSETPSGSAANGPADIRIRQETR